MGSHARVVLDGETDQRCTRARTRIPGQCVGVVRLPSPQGKLLEAETRRREPLNTRLPVHVQPSIDGGCSRMVLMAGSLGVQGDRRRARILPRQEALDRFVITGSKPELKAHRR